MQTQIWQKKTVNIYKRTHLNVRAIFVHSVGRWFVYVVFLLLNRYWSLFHWLFKQKNSIWGCDAFINAFFWRQNWNFYFEFVTCSHAANDPFASTTKQKMIIFEIKIQPVNINLVLSCALNQNPSVFPKFTMRLWLEERLPVFSNNLLSSAFAAISLSVFTHNIWLFSVAEVAFPRPFSRM